MSKITIAKVLSPGLKYALTRLDRNWQRLRKNSADIASIRAISSKNASKPLGLRRPAEHFQSVYKIAQSMVVPFFRDLRTIRIVRGEVSKVIEEGSFFNQIVISFKQ